jgi:hypothetical protein
MLDALYFFVVATTGPTLFSTFCCPSVHLAAGAWISNGERVVQQANWRANGRPRRFARTDTGGLGARRQGFNSTLLSAVLSRHRRSRVLAFVNYKFAAGGGTFRDGGGSTAWRNGEAVQSEIPRYSDEAIAATIQYCNYVYGQYGRFPVNGGPFRTLLAYQAHRLDSDFYSQFYKDNVISESPSHGHQ